MPPLHGLDLEVQWHTGLRAWRGRLLTGLAGQAGGAGHAVHAGSHIRKRQIILDRALCQDPAELSRILVHEVFHFVWVRLSNESRRSWGALLLTEFEHGARGELGWSAEWSKRGLVARGRSGTGRQWSEYICESFCDTAAYVYAGVRGHDEFTLAARWARARRGWFRSLEERQPAGLRV